MFCISKKMTWLPIGVYRTFPLPILPVPPVPPRTLYKSRVAPAVKPLPKVEKIEKVAEPELK
jgi:hypothetical protein